MAHERGIRLLHDAYTKSTSNQKILEWMAMCEWMMRTGKSSEDWNAQPIGDIKSLTLHYIFSKEEYSYIVRNGIALAFSKNK